MGGCSRARPNFQCIAGLDGAVLDGQTLRACLGTTKYCNAFLRYTQCGAWAGWHSRRKRG